MTDDIRYRKSTKSSAQFVYLGETLIGSVRRMEDWTVRGTRVRWEAYRTGNFIGSAPTRKEAASLLRAC